MEFINIVPVANALSDFNSKKQIQEHILNNADIALKDSFCYNPATFKSIQAKLNNPVRLHHKLPIITSELLLSLAKDLEPDFNALKKACIDTVKSYRPL